MSDPAIDPEFLAELNQIRNVARVDRQWYDSEIGKLEEQLRRGRETLYQEYRRRQMQHQNAEDFIRDHPSSAELERQSCIEQLVNSKKWNVCDEPRRMSGHTWYLVISRSGFPTSVLVSTVVGKPTMPEIAQRLAEQHSFTASINYREFYTGPN